jgi:hypothetical protein
MSDQLVNNIRRENYPLEIYSAFGGKIDAATVSKMTVRLTSFIQDVYRSLEPGHFQGRLIIFSSLDDSIFFDEESSTKLVDRNILFNNSSKLLVIQYFQSDALPVAWQNIEAEHVFESTETIVYTYNNNKESFFVNNVTIPIINRFDCASIYALQYHYLNEALLRYKEEKIRYSSCAIFHDSWFDQATRLFFVQQPEEIMQVSLREFLHSALRGVDVVREYNLGASKPVDIRVYWKEANRAALIEIKWLGESKDKSGELSTEYSNGRGNDGLDQLKEYMDLENKDTPTCITKVYLIIIDGRRRGLRKNSTTISVADGMYYSDKELVFKDNKKFFEGIIGFERPMRMFSSPVCA